MGRSKKTIVGKSVYDIAPEHLARRYEEKDTELFRNPGFQAHETTVQRFNGEIRDVIFNKATYEDAEKRLAGSSAKCRAHVCSFTCLEQDDNDQGNRYDYVYNNDKY